MGIKINFKSNKPSNNHNKSLIGGVFRIIFSIFGDVLKKLIVIIVLIMLGLWLLSYFNPNIYLLLTSII